MRLPEGLTPSGRVIRLALAVGLAFAAVAARFLADTTLDGDLGYVTYVAAVAVAAWLGGLTTGLLTTAMCALTQSVMFGGFGAAVSSTSPMELLRLTIFLVDGLLISAVSSALRRLSYREHQERSASTIRFLAEREAHDRAEASRLALERLQLVTATLAQAVTQTEVAEAALDRGLQTLGAVAGGVSRLSADGEAVELIASRGYPAVLVEASQRYSLDRPSHFSEGVRSRAPIFIPNMEEWRARYPDAPAQPLGSGQREAALAVVPLLASERVLGALVFRFDEARDFGDGTGELILRLAEQCAQALDRAIAHDQQHQAMDALQRGNRRLEFLARASELLGSARETGPLLEAVAHVAAESVADWCVIELFDPDGPAVYVGHPRAEGVAQLRELASLAPDHLATWLAPQITEGGGILCSDRATWREQLSDRRARELVDALGAEAWAVVPITRANETIGAVMLGGSSRDRLRGIDLAVAQDLAARIETTLERSNLYGTVSRFKTTVDASLDAVFMFDPRSLALTYVNRGAGELAGAPVDELLGVSVLALQQQLSRADLRRRIEPLLTGEAGSIDYTGVLSRRDGRDVPIDALLQCVRLPDGTVTLVLTARDVSDRVEFQARLSRVATNERRRARELDAILEALGDGILVVDANDRVLLANAAAKEICGTTPESLEQVAAILRVKEAALPLRAVSSGDRTVELPDGRWIQVSTFPTGSTGAPDGGEQVATILVLRDVTRSREAAQAQEAFMGVLSHELRTPVTSIFGYAKVLRRPGLREQSEEMLSDIEAEADRLYRIVEDLLALSRVQAGFTVEGEPLLLQHLVEPLVAAEAQRWPQITVVQELPSDLPTVFGERTYVEQVLRNLISNAAKYSHGGTTVTIAGLATGNEVQIRVLDRGVGIAAGEADQLFRLFYRSPTTARQASGAGIGLYVCRGLVQAMGGRIWAAARDGGGSEFGFTLPVAETELEAE